MPIALKYLLLTLCLTLLQACGNKGVDLSEKIVTVEGQAIIKNGAKLLARKMAIRDAIRQSSLQNSGQIKSRTLVKSQSIALDAFTLKTTAQINNTEIIDEWVTDNIFHVRAIVRLSDANMCTPMFRKRIIATAFPMVHPSQSSMAESNDLSSGIPREINNILAETGAYIGKNLTQTVIFNEANLAPEVLGAHPYQISTEMKLAQKHRGQFILSGVIRDLEISPAHYNRGSGIESLLNSYTSYLSSTRAITVDIYLHDGYTGALLFQHRYRRTAKGKVIIPHNVVVGSDEFKETDTGNKITSIINQAVQDIQQSLNCYPLYTRILKIDENKVFIDAGAQEQVNIGDQLVVYSSLGTINAAGSGQEIIGHHKKPAGILTITEVTPLFSVGELESPPHILGVKEGDWVKSW